MQRLLRPNGAALNITHQVAGGLTDVADVSTGTTAAHTKARSCLFAALVLISPGLVLVVATGLWWVDLLTLLGLAMLFCALVEVLTQHRRVSLNTSWADGVIAWFSNSSVLIAFASWPAVRLLSREVLLPETTAMVLAAGVVVTAAAASIAWEVGPGLDRRVMLMLLAAGGVLLAHLLSALSTTHLAEVPLVLLMSCAAAAWLLVLVSAAASQPQAVKRGGGSVSGEVLNSIVSAAEAVGVLLLAHLGAVPDVAVGLAVAALACIGARFVSLLREVLLVHDAYQRAMKDEVTGLGNRRALLVATEKALSFKESRAALVVLHVEGLEEVVDAWGHENGDSLLRQLAARLVKALPSEALAARTEGGSFAVLLPDGQPQEVDRLAKRVLDVVGEPFGLVQRAVQLRAAVGIADQRSPLSSAPSRQSCAGASIAQEAVDLLRRAQAAASGARAVGGEPMRHHSRMDEAVRARLDQAAALACAIDAGQLVLHYQPQVRTDDGGIGGAEALVRWDHPGQGLVPPDLFLPLVAQLGLQPQVTRWVLFEAVREAARWWADGACVPVSVNLAAEDLRPGLQGDVARALSQAGLPARALVLEITETGLVADLEAAAQILQELVALGVEVSIDDYGTGYSSLSLLVGLPVSELKIDRSLTAALVGNSRSDTVVRTTVDLAHSLGMRVVAEGVESEAVMSHLRELGCDISQGYLHSRPLPPAEFRGWLESRRARVSDVVAPLSARPA